jgi:hypothetical protein
MCTGIAHERESLPMSEIYEPSADDLIARRFAGRFFRHDESMWFDMPTAQEVVEFCVSQGIAVVRIDDEWDWPEGRQQGSYDNRVVPQRSLTWDEVVQTCGDRAQMYFKVVVSERPEYAASFAFYTEAAWQEQYA